MPSRYWFLASLAFKQLSELTPTVVLVDYVILANRKLRTD